MTMSYKDMKVLHVCYVGIILAIAQIYKEL